MNLKTINKIVMIIVMLGCIFVSPVYAAGSAADSAAAAGAGGLAGLPGMGSTDINPDDYRPNTSSVENGDKLKNIGNDIIGFLQIIGTILSVLVLAVIGIKYMMGSVNERAEYKKAMLPYVIGAVMVFAITNLLGIIASISGNLL